MNFEKYSFIGKIEKVDSDFNTYLEQLEAMKNIELDPSTLATPEFYLQTIINRKRPETAIPCNLRTNRNPSIDESEIKIKSSRIKTSINKRDSINKQAEYAKSPSEDRNAVGNTIKPNKNGEGKKFNIGEFENMFDFDPDFLNDNNLNHQNEIIGEPINIDNVNEESAFPNRPQAFTTNTLTAWNMAKNKITENVGGFNNFRIKNTTGMRSNFCLVIIIDNIF